MSNDKGTLKCCVARSGRTDLEGAGTPATAVLHAADATTCSCCEGLSVCVFGYQTVT